MPSSLFGRDPFVNCVDLTPSPLFGCRPRHRDDWPIFIGPKGLAVDTKPTDPMASTEVFAALKRAVTG